MLAPKKNATYTRSRRSKKVRQSQFDYSTLEPRKVLSAYFPTYIDGQLTLGNPNSTAPYQLSETFNLSTDPSATKTIYLDFDGYQSVNDGWGHNIQFPSYDRNGNPNSFSNAELIEIQLIFQNVAEDFAPFNVNVTTKDPGVEALRRTGPDDIRWGIRAVNSQATSGFGDDFGGIAYLNSFTSSADVPVFIFNKGINAAGQTNSHEVGHALGLSHDGLGNRAYHPGSGSGETSWGPLLGAPFRANVTQFSNGDYTGSTTQQDDLGIITTNSGFGYRADDYGNSISAASSLSVNGNSQVFDWGIVERNTDRDFLRFQTGAGNVNLSVNAFDGNPNLDILARIYDANGSVVATSNPSNGVDASFNVSLGAGTYYLSIEGTGRDGSYTDYGSLGFYTVEGSINAAQTSSAIGESGRIPNVNHAWKTVRFDNTYFNPVVVAGPASRNGLDPVTVRVRNVTSTGFQIRVDEYEYLDGGHTQETVNYIVIEAGIHELSNGTVVSAGLQNNQTHAWKSYSFGSAFASSNVAPIVLSQISSNNEGVAASTRAGNVTKDGFVLKIFEEQASNQQHAAETVGWIAIEQGQGTNDGSLFEAFSTAGVSDAEYQLDFQSNFERAPAFFAGIQSNNGGDTANVRYNTLSRVRTRIFVEEERSADFEVNHVPEDVGYLAVERGTIEGRTARNVVSTTSFTVNNETTTSDPFSNWLSQFFGNGFSSQQFSATPDGDLSLARAELESWEDIALESFHHDRHDDHEYAEEELEESIAALDQFVNVQLFELEEAATIETILVSSILDSLESNLSGLADEIERFAEPFEAIERHIFQFEFETFRIENLNNFFDELF